MWLWLALLYTIGLCGFGTFYYALGDLYDLEKFKLIDFILWPINVCLIIILILMGKIKF